MKEGAHSEKVESAKEEGVRKPSTGGLLPYVSPSSRIVLATSEVFWVLLWIVIPVRCLQALALCRAIGPTLHGSDAYAGVVPLSTSDSSVSSAHATVRLAPVTIQAASNLWPYFTDWHRCYLTGGSRWLLWDLEPQGLTFEWVGCSCKTLNWQPVCNKLRGPFGCTLWKSCKLRTSDYVPPWPPHLWRSSDM